MSINSPVCSRCEKLPGPLEARGRLFIWAPLRHSAGKLLPWIRDCEMIHELRESEECLVVFLDDSHGQLPEMARRLSAEELEGTRVLFMAGEGRQEPSFSDFPRVTTFAALVAQAENRWLVELMARNGFCSFFQPIVRACAPQEVMAHEALLRGHDEQGEIIGAGRILSAARASGLLFQVDRAARLCAIRESVRCGIQSRIFINFTPTSIYDPVNCLRSTVALIRELQLDPRRFVFEVVESEEVEDSSHLLKILNYYRSSGFSVALDDLGSGYASLNRMVDLKPDFVKLDMKLIQGVDLDPVKSMVADRLLSLAREIGIQTIVEGVERPEELEWAQAHGADFVQGYLIARPNYPPQTPLSSLAVASRAGRHN